MITIVEIRDGKESTVVSGTDADDVRAQLRKHASTGDPKWLDLEQYFYRCYCPRFGTQSLRTGHLVHTKA